MKGQPEQVCFQWQDDATGGEWHVVSWYRGGRKTSPQGQPVSYARYPVASFPALSWTREAALAMAEKLAAYRGCTQWCASSQTWSRP